MKASVVRILLLEDEASDAELIARALVRGGILSDTRVVDTGDAFSRTLAEFLPDLVLSDHSGARFTALDALTLVRRTQPATPVILVTGALNDPAVVDCLKAGAEDVVFKNRLDQLAPAIQAALAVRQPVRRLSPRQLTVLQLLATGLSCRAVAERLGGSVRTIETHRAALMQRLQIHNLPSLVRYAVRIGLVPPRP